MKLIKPSWSIFLRKPGLEGIYESIELAGRTCYKSQRKEGTTAKDFVDRMINSKHFSMLEHGTVYLIIYGNGGKKYLDNPYSKVTKLYDKRDWENSYGKPTYYISTNYRVLVENEWLDDLKYLCEPTDIHEKRVTVLFTTSNGIMREFTRHRKFSFAVESTRYCNYSKDRFNNEITFIKPTWVKEKMNKDEVVIYFLYKSLLIESETNYLGMIAHGAKPQEARGILPLDTKCDMVMTGFVSDWKHFFDLRTSIIAETGKPHPDAAILADPLYEEFKNRNLI